MQGKALSIAVVGILTLGLPVMGSAQEQERMEQQQGRMEMQEQKPEQVYGWQLMSEKERQDFRQRLRQAKTREERERIRQENHEKMKERARQKGVTLPEKPEQYRKGLGPGPSRPGEKRGGRY